MKPLLLLIAVALTLVAYSCTNNNTESKELAQQCCSENATCSGGKNCTACKNCKYCKHCSKEGGTCSVCK